MDVEWLLTGMDQERILDGSKFETKSELGSIFHTSGKSQNGTLKDFEWN